MVPIEHAEELALDRVTLLQRLAESGTFANDYKRLFGVALPTETLAPSARHPLPPPLNSAKTGAVSQLKPRR